MSREKGLLFAIVLTVALLHFPGCFSARPSDIQAFTKPYQVAVNADNYILQPPDEIEINCQKVPEINQQRQQIRPDGRITLEAFGEIEVAGKTPAQVAEILKGKAAATYTLPGNNPINVKVLVFRSHYYYVVGEVVRPGPKPYTGRDTTLQAITDASLQVTAWKDQIQVIRPSADPEQRPRIFRLDMKKMLTRGDTSHDVLLQEGDIIYVPPTILAAVAEVIAEFARPIGEALSPATQVAQVSYIYR